MNLPPDMLTIGPISFHAGYRLAFGPGGKRLALTGSMVAALTVFAEANGQPVTREQLSRQVFKRELGEFDRTVDQLIFTLRLKLPPDESGQSLIQSIRHVGYWMRAPDVAPPVPPACAPDLAQAA